MTEISERKLLEYIAEHFVTPEAAERKLELQKGTEGTTVAKFLFEGIGTVNKPVFL
jgi:hypothetical protein